MIQANTPHLVKHKILNRGVFDVQIARLEAAKNDNYSPHTISVWYDEMIIRGWTDEIFITRVKAVLETKQFGSIRFDDFINALKLYTEEDVQIKVQQEIEALRKRIAEAKTKSINEKVIDEELLESEHHIYAQRLDDIRERLGISLKQRLKKAERFIKSAPEETKKDLLKLLTDKKLLDETDPHWMQIIHYFTPRILNETEQIMKRI